jgi:hypothetical protein
MHFLAKQSLVHTFSSPSLPDSESTIVFPFDEARRYLRHKPQLEVARNLPLHNMRERAFDKYNYPGVVLEGVRWPSY